MKLTIFIFPAEEAATPKDDSRKSQEDNSNGTAQPYQQGQIFSWYSPRRPFQAGPSFRAFCPISLKPILPIYDIIYWVLQ